MATKKPVYNNESITALKGADPNATTEELVRHALRAMVMKS
mgnify:CR=1 FL=1